MVEPTVLIYDFGSADGRVQQHYFASDWLDYGQLNISEAARRSRYFSRPRHGSDNPDKVCL